MSAVGKLQQRSAPRGAISSLKRNGRVVLSNRLRGEVNLGLIGGGSRWCRHSASTLGVSAKEVSSLPYAWKSLLSVACLGSFPFLCFGRLCLHVGVALAWLLHLHRVDSVKKQRTLATNKKWVQRGARASSKQLLQPSHWCPSCGRGFAAGIGLISFLRSYAQKKTRTRLVAIFDNEGRRNNHTMQHNDNPQMTERHKERFYAETAARISTFYFLFHVFYNFC